MREHERESARDDAFEALLAQSVDELPPEEIVADVTPWRRAMEPISSSISWDMRAPVGLLGLFRQMSLTPPWASFSRRARSGRKPLSGDRGSSSTLAPRESGMEYSC